VVKVSAYSSGRCRFASWSVSALSSYSVFVSGRSYRYAGGSVRELKKDGKGERQEKRKEHSIFIFAPSATLRRKQLQAGLRGSVASTTS